MAETKRNNMSQKELAKELVYFSFTSWLVFGIMELIHPNIVLAYFNPNILLLLFLAGVIILLTIKSNKK
jgi:uncharacterized membrane protein